MQQKEGLIEKQIQAVEMLIAGKNQNEIAQELEIDRTTLYNWRKKLPFQAYYNKLLNEIKENTKESVLSLHETAIQKVKDVLENGNANAKLKAAFYIIDKVNELTVGESDLREMIKKKCTFSELEDWNLNKLDEDKYNQLCKENGIKPES
ncbi:MAG: phBC6A51 family helix-turn-helix protein [Bacteroidales bacterium]